MTKQKHKLIHFAQNKGFQTFGSSKNSLLTSIHRIQSEQQTSYIIAGDTLNCLQFDAAPLKKNPTK